MEPASSIIKKLGGHAVVSQITRTARPTPYNWEKAREQKGTGGIIPLRHVQVLLDYARTQQISLKYEDFFRVAMKPPQRRRRSAA